MRLLQLQNLSVLFPGRTLFEDVTWSIFRGEKYGLVGPNGAGKTTLLKMLIGEFEQSSGDIIRSRGLTIGYLPQTSVTHAGRSLFEEAWGGIPDLPAMELEINSIQRELELKPDDPELLERMGVLQHRWQDLEGYRAEARVAAILHGLNFSSSDCQRQVEEFSGGWQMRIALARLLLKDPDLLLLDEPTNHLDLQTLLWLENYLSKFGGTQIIVSHDRSFLNRAVDQIVELDRGELTIFPGNYEDYEKAIENREEYLEKQQEKIAAQRKHLEKFVERFRYKQSKAKQAQSRIKMLERLDSVEIKSASRKIRIRFPSAPPCGQIVLELEDVAKRYGDLEVFKEANLVLKRGERIAIVGVNGAGKSTFCRLVAGIEEATEGNVKLGHNVVVDYFAQEADVYLNPANTVLEEMESASRELTQTQLRGLLGAFLFTGDDVFKRVSVLSGGEKSRLALARMLLHPSNLLILDEPTNHLDMNSQDVLLDALRDYNGTLLIVSHDRYFLDRLVERVIEFENHALRDWPGTLSRYIEKKGLLTPQTEITERIPLQETEIKTVGPRKSKEQKRLEAEIRNRFSKMIRTEQEKLESLQTTIDKLESRKAEIESQLSNENFYNDIEKSRETVVEYKRIQAELPGLMEGWENTAQKLEELQSERDKTLRLEGQNPIA
ncbi:ABC transporter ATP-binding protein [bacterium]|nr:MAG: ABC transporter ATP-binding protein [bacterium]